MKKLGDVATSKSNNTVIALTAAESPPQGAKGGRKLYDLMQIGSSQIEVKSLINTSIVVGLGISALVLIFFAGLIY